MLNTTFVTGSFGDWWRVNLNLLHPQSIIIIVLCSLQFYTVFRRFQGPNYTHIENEPEKVRDNSLIRPLVYTCFFFFSMIITQFKYFDSISKQGHPELIPMTRTVHASVMCVHAVLLHLACLPDRERLIELVGGIQMFRVFFYFFVSYWFMAYGLVYSDLISRIVVSSIKEA